MNLEDLMAQYLATKPEHKDQKKALIEKALHLESELHDQEHQ